MACIDSLWSQAKKSVFLFMSLGTTSMCIGEIRFFLSPLIRSISTMGNLTEESKAAWVESGYD